MNTDLFFGALGPGTRGCLDIHDVDTPCRHLCDGTIGVVGAQEAGYDADDGPPEARWRIGTQVRMRQICEAGGPYPQCFLVARFADVAQLVEHLMEHDSDGWETPYPRTGAAYHDWAPLRDYPCASFQWKGANLDLTFTCPLCGTHGHVEGAFGYHVGCAKCRAGFAVDSYVPCERVA